MSPMTNHSVGAIQVRHIYISPGHNYFGRHDQPPDTHPVVKVREAKCVTRQGIQGDRFFGCKPDYKGQITFFAWETYEAICLALSMSGKPPSVFRRNVITSGVDLNDLIGREFQIQGVRFSGTEECRPCHGWTSRSRPVRMNISRDAAGCGQ